MPVRKDFCRLSQPSGKAVPVRFTAEQEGLIKVENMNAPNGPVITGVHHVCLTVTDVDTSMNWYQQLFQAERWPGRLPHYAREETGFAEMLVEPHTGLLIGLHHHTARRSIA